MSSLFLALLLLLPVSLQAREEILSYHSDIEVYETGEMTVTENITVRAEGNRIKRGIYRDFPTNYRDRFGNRYRVGFNVEGVLRNGQIEAWHTQSLANGVRVYFGSSDNYIDKGVHKYRFRYRTNRQLGFFEDHDELYWNVTGNDWAFPINKASALVKLPDSIPADSITVEAYTGAQGSKGRDYHAEVRGDGLVYFETTRPLPQRHGLTIVTAFPRGHIREPTADEKLQYLIDDNRQLLYLGFGLLLVLAYYWITWLLVGRDPQAGVIITRYRPPEGYSPASMRFIENMGYDNTCFAVALVNLTVKGYLTISEVPSISGLSAGKYSLQKTGKTNINMAPGESALTRKLFAGSNLITLEQANHKRIREAKSAHETALRQNYEKIYFVTNTWYFLVGVLLTLLVLITGFLAAPGPINEGSLFLLVWLTFWTFGVIALLKMAWLQWKRVKQSMIYILTALLYSAFAIPFVAAEIIVLGQLVKLTSYTLVGMILAIMLINWLFYELLKAPTLAGRKLLDRIEGFRHYIEVAERNELESRYAPEKTPEKFEEYLPYAMALGMETQWASIFTGAFRDLEIRGLAYRPDWYTGTDWDIVDLANFSSSFSASLSSAVASSSTPPGSSSGSGGGGFSGGGGGGGGGGGW